MRDWVTKSENLAEKSIEELSKGVVPRVHQGNGHNNGSGGEQKVNDQTGGLPAANADAEGGNGEQLGVVAIQVFERILFFPDETIGERCTNLRIGKPQEWRARRKLGQVGLLKSEGKIGKWEFFGPTELGDEWREQKGIRKWKFKSGLLHEILVSRAEAGVAKAFKSVDVCRGGALNEVQYDLLVQINGRGMNVPLQVSVTNSVEYELQAVKKLLAHRSVVGAIVIGVSKGKAADLERGLRNSGYAAVSGRVVVLAGEDVVRGGVGWKGVLKGAVKASREGRQCVFDFK